MKYLLLLFSLCYLLSCRVPPTPPPDMRSQYPSPMVDYTRPHHRIPLDSVPDAGVTVDLPGSVRGTLYVPDAVKNESRVDLLIHFHGDGRVARHAVDRHAASWVLFHAQWGHGSSAYGRPVGEIGAEALLDTIRRAVRARLPNATISRIVLSGWSAGYGAIRAMIGDGTVAERVDGIMLLDGLHCSYVPEGQVLADGGALDSLQMRPFLDWARRAADGEKSFLITHSAVFPGTYASTTETAEYLLRQLGIGRQPQLAEGPVGMQQTSVAGRGRFLVLSFAGNSAPDHVDHYHGLGEFLRRLSFLWD